MSTILSKCSRGLLALAVIGSVSCGSGSNNDQGTSVLARGYFGDVEGDTGVVGSAVPLFTEAPSIDIGSGNPYYVDGNQLVVFMAVENRLTSQFMRLDRIECDYSIPGSTLNVPSDSFTIGAIIPQAAVDEDGLLVDGGAISYSGFQMLSPDIISFINNNQNSLPQLPFRMNSNCQAVGQSQAGDVYTTNGLGFTIQFFQAAEGSDAEGEPDDIGPSFILGPGTGGTISTFGTGNAEVTDEAIVDDEFVDEDLDAE